MGKNWKDTISKEKLQDADIEEALKMLLESRKKASESQSDASQETGAADTSSAQETKEYFTLDEVKKLIAQTVSEQLKQQPISQPIQTPSFVNPKPPASFKVLKMKEVN